MRTADRSGPFKKGNQDQTSQDWTKIFKNKEQAQLGHRIDSGNIAIHFCARRGTIQEVKSNFFDVQDTGIGRQTKFGELDSLNMWCETRVT